MWDKYDIETVHRFLALLMRGLPPGPVVQETYVGADPVVRMSLDATVYLIHDRRTLSAAIDALTAWQEAQ